MPSLPTFSFQALQSLEAELILGYEGPVLPRNLEVRQFNPLYTFWLIQRGSAELHINDQRYPIPTHHWVLIPAMTRRHHVLAPCAALLSLSFHWSWPHGEPVLRFDEPIIAEASLHPEPPRAAQAVVGTLPASPQRDLYAHHLHLPQWYAHLGAFHAFLSCIAAMVVRYGGTIVAPRETDPRLAPILRQLAQSPSIRPLPYDQWRSLTGIGREQIDRLARRRLGMTLHAWRNRQLGRTIRRRLLSDAAVIKTIASDLGFVDSAHFNRWCRKHLKARPSDLLGAGA